MWFNQNANSGYVGYSMSVRAQKAYDDGEMPLSKWTKSEILYNLEDRGVDISYLSKYSKEVLIRFFLRRSSWHHTSQCFNETDFYELSDYAVGQAIEDVELTIEELDKIKQEVKNEKLRQKGCDKNENILEVVEIRYGEWEGTRNHLKLKQYTSLGIKKGDWVWISTDKRKGLNGKHVEIIQRYSRAPKGEGQRLNVIRKKLMK